MIDTQGFPLESAVRLLRDAGCVVRSQEVRSKKGVEGGEARVLRQTETADGAVELTYAYCKTEPEA